MKKQLSICLGLWILFATCATAATTSAATSTASTDLTASNVVVDFTATTFSTSVMRGNSGVMNLVIKNTGGYVANNVQVSIPSTGVAHIDKTADLGDIVPGNSQTIPVVYRVDANARTGLTVIHVSITYDGYQSDGTKNNNQQVGFDIPFTVLGNPEFQVDPSKTTYYKDNLDVLNLTGVTKDNVKDLEVTLTGTSSSQTQMVNINSNVNANQNASATSCITVLGSSRVEVGDVTANQPFNVVYNIKPTSAGACTASAHLTYTDESGGANDDTVQIGLNVEDAGVNLKVTNISYDPTGPGEEADVVLTLTNVGKADADDVSMYLNMTSPFAPIDTSEKYVQHIGAGESVDVEYKIAIDYTAVTQTYSLPLVITYNVGGTTNTVSKDIGIDVNGEITLAVMNVDTSKGNVRIAVSNIGTRDANGVKATLIVPNANRTAGGAGRRGGGQGENATGGPGAGFNRTGGGFGGGNMNYLISYQSSIKATKQATFTFTTTATGPAVLLLEYTGINNKRINQTDNVFLGGGGAGGAYGSSSTSMTDYAIYAVVLLAVVYVGNKMYKRRKAKNA